MIFSLACVRKHVTAAAAFVDDDDLSRLEVADHLRAEQIERARLGGDIGDVAAPAERERTKSPGIAGGDQLVVMQEDERVRPLHLPERLHECLGKRAFRLVGDQVEDQFGIRTRLEQRAAAFKNAALCRRVGQVAVMGDGKRTARERVGRQRLDVAGGRAARRGVTDVSDGAAARDAAHLCLIERGMDKAGSLAADDLSVFVRPGDAGRFLAAVLQCVKAEVDVLSQRGA